MPGPSNMYEYESTEGRATRNPHVTVVTDPSRCKLCGKRGRHPSINVVPDQLLPFFHASDDAWETRKLKEDLAGVLGKAGASASLGVEELRRIARWKLGSQWGRVEGHLSQLTEDLVRCVTGATLALSGHDLPDEIATRVSLDLLRSLPGVGMGVASAVLALTLPDHYCVIDFRGWRALFHPQERREFTKAHYLTYRAGVICLARQLDRSVQDVDHALWELDRHRQASK